MKNDSFYRDLYAKVHDSQKKYRENNQGLILYNKWSKLILKNDSIIDLGCGNGKLCNFLIDNNHDVTGVDVVHADYDRSKYSFIEKDLINGKWDFGDNFEVAVCFDVLEHFDKDDISSFLKNFFKIGKVQIFSIAHYGFTNDSHIHKTVEPLEWWLGKMDDNVKLIEQINRGKKHKKVSLLYRDTR